MKTVQQIRDLWNDYEALAELEIESLRNRLDDAEKALGFYAEDNRWSKPILRQGRIISMPKLETSSDAGKIARDYFTKYGEKL